ncbi:MAG: hypothetical protein M3150_05650 [Pseudomonadota bacterium]|nr:hypothetical protein [Pseudomonadota bacterium]
MRALFGVLGLLVVVLVIGLLAKKQLGSMAGPPGLPTPAGTAPSGAAGPVSPQQTVRRFQQAVEGQMQQARPMPDDPK